MKKIIFALIVCCTAIAGAHEDLETEIIRLEEKMPEVRNPYTKIDTITKQTDYLELRLDIMELKLELMIEQFNEERAATDAVLEQLRTLQPADQ